MDTKSINPLAKALAENLPPVIMRSDWDRLHKEHGLPLTRGTLANLDSQGKGPKAHRLNGKTGYLREDVLEWLENRASKRPVPPHPPKHGSVFRKTASSA